MKPRFIIIDGPDEAGKSTLINSLINSYNCIPFKYPKKVKNELFKINSYNDFEIVKMFLHMINPGIYVSDRFYFSNIVYDSILRNEDTTPSIEFRKWVLENFDVLEIILTRNRLDTDFTDNNISIPKHEFNMIIQQYESLNIPFFKILHHSQTGEFLYHCNKTQSKLNNIVSTFITK